MKNKLKSKLVPSRIIRSCCLKVLSLRAYTNVSEGTLLLGHTAAIPLNQSACMMFNTEISMGADAHARGFTTLIKCMFGTCLTLMTNSSPRSPSHEE